MAESVNVLKPPKMVRSQHIRINISPHYNQITHIPAFFVVRQSAKPFQHQLESVVFNIMINLREGVGRNEKVDSIWSCFCYLIGAVNSDVVVMFSWFWSASTCLINYGDDVGILLQQMADETLLFNAPYVRKFRFLNFHKDELDWNVLQTGLFDADFIPTFWWQLCQVSSPLRNSNAYLKTYEKLCSIKPLSCCSIVTALISGLAKLETARLSVKV